MAGEGHTGRSGDGPASVTSSRPLSLLVAEDEEMNRILLRAILARAPDARLREARLAEVETLVAARLMMDDSGTPIDLCLLDVQLADGSGLDLIPDLAARTPRPRIVVMTAGVLSAQREAAEKAGCDAFISKPYMPAELIATILALVPAERV